VLHAAKEDWLDKFSAPVPDGELSEPQMGPPIPAMIDAIGAVAGPAATELQRLHGTVKGYIRQYNKNPKPMKWKYDNPQRRPHQFF
jgi:hypothetical protein